MKSISLFVDKDTYLTRLHPFAKMLYIVAAISVPLITGTLWMFGVFIAVSLGLLISGKIIKKVFPLIAFSFTIIITVFLIHGLFNRENQNVLAALGPLKFYKEGLLYASRIGLNILNMLLAFAMFVLTTKPATLVDDLEQAGFSPRFGYMISSVFQIIPQMMGTMNTIMDAQRSRGMETEGLLYASRIGLNILNMLLAFAMFVLTTKPATLVDDLEQAGFSPRFGYMISSVFQIIPQMMGTMNTIMDAQRSRGMETEGSLFVRAKAFIPLISPVVSSSLINTRERAIALEVRGFDSKTKKTFLSDHKLKGRDRAFMVLMVLLIAGSIVWRVIRWL